MKGPPPFRFENLASYTRDEVRLWNWFCRLFPGRQDWQGWVSEVFGELLASPGTRQLVLAQTYSLQPQQAERELVIEKEEYRIGRGTDNDLVLPATAIATSHARIFLQDGQYVLEDLGSALGTYVDRKRLQARQPYALRSGDRFTMFPYSFTVRYRETWIPESRVRVSSPRARSMRWEDFRGAATADAVPYSVLVHPIGKAACLEARRSFLAELVNLLLPPVGLEGAEAGVTPSDDGLLEFILLSVLERANRGLRYPFQYALASCTGLSRYDPDSRGIGLAFSMELSGVTGAVRAYFPYELLAAMEAESPRETGFPLPPAISFQFTASAGYVELTADELRRVEASDILLFTSDGELLFPADFHRGWKASLKKDQPWILEIDNYFERSVLMDETGKGEQVAGGQAVPDFSRLTIRLHVVLGEKELTLTEANGLVRGTILELDRSKTDPVQLAINGKIVGDGELVDVEGRLGVRILSWRVS